MEEEGWDVTAARGVLRMLEGRGVSEQVGILAYALKTAARRGGRDLAVLPTCRDCTHCPPDRGMTSSARRSGICTHPSIAGTDIHRWRETARRVDPTEAPPSWCPFRQSPPRAAAEGGE